VECNCVNVEECDNHINIISPVPIRVVFLSPTSARTDALHSIKTLRRTWCLLHFGRRRAHRLFRVSL
jgi:hypothetical protein